MSFSLAISLVDAFVCGLAAIIWANEPTPIATFFFWLNAVGSIYGSVRGTFLLFHGGLQ